MQFKISFFISLFILLLGCNNHEQKIVGTWEYESFKVDEDGIGALVKFLPENWLLTAEEWLTSSKGITNSRLEFRPDGTYRELFTGAAERFTDISGNFSLSKDLNEIKLLVYNKEQTMRIENLNDTSFVYLKSFDKYEVPLTLRILYVKVEDFN